MNTSQLAADYNTLRQKLAHTVPERERLFQNGAFDLVNYKALADANRDVLFVLIKLTRDDRRFRHLLGDKMFSKNQINKLLAAESPHAKLLKSYEEFFIQITRSVNPKIRELRRFIYNQTKVKDAKYITEQELNIRRLTGEISKILAPYQTLSTMVHKEAPGTDTDQDVNDPQRFVSEPLTSLWVFVKMISEMEVYLMTVSGIAKETPSPTERTEDKRTEGADDRFVGYEDREYSFSYAVARFRGDTVLASAGEVAQFRQQTNKKGYFFSRTACLHFTENGTQYVVFNDDPEENILLKQAKEEDGIPGTKSSWNKNILLMHVKGGYGVPRTKSPWIADPSLVRRMIEHGRRIKLEKSSFVSVDQIADHSVIITMLGHEGAKAHQQFIQQNKWPGTSLSFLDKCPKKGVEIRWLGVGTFSAAGLGVLDDLYGGHAVGVRKNSIR